MHNVAKTPHIFLRQSRQRRFQETTEEKSRCNCFHGASDFFFFFFTATGFLDVAVSSSVSLRSRLSVPECSVSLSLSFSLSSTTSNPAPGKCQVEFSAWVRATCAAQPSMSAKYSTWSGGGQNADRLERRDTRGGGGGGGSYRRGRPHTHSAGQGACGKLSSATLLGRYSVVTWGSIWRWAALILDFMYLYSI